MKLKIKLLKESQESEIEKILGLIDVAAENIEAYGGDLEEDPYVEQAFMLADSLDMLDQLIAAIKKKYDNRIGNQKRDLKTSEDMTGYLRDFKRTKKGFEGSHRDIMIALSDLQDNQYVINEDLIRNLWSKIEKDEVDFEKLDLMSSIIRIKRTPEDVMMGMLSQVGSEWDIERSVGLSKAKGLTPRALEKYYFSKLADSENSLQWLLNNPNLTAKILDHIVYDKPERFKTDNFKYRAKKHRNFKPRPKESPMKKASSFFSKFF